MYFSLDSIEHPGLDALAGLGALSREQTRVGRYSVPSFNSAVVAGRRGRGLAALPVGFLAAGGAAVFGAAGGVFDFSLESAGAGDCR